MSYCNINLTGEEAARNKHGPMLIYTYTHEDKGPFVAPNYFSTIQANHTNVQLMSYDDIVIPRDKLIKGAFPGAPRNVYYPGFPTMKHLKYKVSFVLQIIHVFLTVISLLGYT